MTVQFYHTTPGDLNDVFEVDSGNSQFKIPYTENTAKEGVYSVNYRVHYQKYPNVFAATNTAPFEFTITDPCLSPVVLELGEDLVDQEYTVTTANLVYEVPVFNVSPTWCSVVYSVVSITPALEDQGVVSFDAVKRTFSFFD